MKTKSRDFIFYLCFNIINSIAIFILLLFFYAETESILSKIKITSSFCLVHIVMVLVLLCMIYVGMNFQFEAFTYIFIFVSIIISVASLKELSQNCIQFCIGMSLLNLGIYSRFALWKYDILKLDNKENT